MAVREILKMGDPRLLRIAHEVTEFDTPELHALVGDLVDTMASAGGAGLAAPQIGVNLQLVVFGGFERLARYPEAPPVPLTALINPVIEPLDLAEIEGWEGCLSVPGLRGLVPRHQHIRYKGMNVLGQVLEREVHGFHAVLVQHETDHLIGRLYPTRMTDMTRLGFTDVLFADRSDSTEPPASHNAM